MTDYNYCLSKIDQVLLELDNYVLYYLEGEEGWAVRDTRKVVRTMKEYCLEGRDFNERLIRAFIDITVVSVRNFENINLGEAIYELSGYLSNTFPKYRSYQPLGMDFGNGEPF